MTNDGRPESNHSEPSLLRLMVAGFIEIVRLNAGRATWAATIVICVLALTKAITAYAGTQTKFDFKFIFDIFEKLNVSLKISVVTNIAWALIYWYRWKNHKYEREKSREQIESLQEQVKELSQVPTGRLNRKGNRRS